MDHTNTSRRVPPLNMASEKVKVIIYLFIYLFIDYMQAVQLMAVYINYRG